MATDKLPDIGPIEVRQEKKKWYKIQWFADSDTPEERKLIWKLDLLIIPYAFLAYWVKYIDQSNLSEYSFIFYPTYTPQEKKKKKKEKKKKLRLTFSC